MVVAAAAENNNNKGVVSARGTTSSGKMCSFTKKQMLMFYLRLLRHSRGCGCDAAAAAAGGEQKQCTLRSQHAKILCGKMKALIAHKHHDDDDDNLKANCLECRVFRELVKLEKPPHDCVVA